MSDTNKKKEFRAIWSNPRDTGKTTRTIIDIIHRAKLAEASELKITVETPDVMALQKELADKTAALEAVASWGVDHPTESIARTVLSAYPTEKRGDG